MKDLNELRRRRGALIKDMRALTDKADAVIDGVIALLYSPRLEPVTTDATVKSTKLLVSPDEGTA